MLKGKNIYLRAVERTDATTLLLWENDSTNWKVSGTKVPFSLDDILKYIDNQQFIRETGQLRFIISDLKSDVSLGAIDLFQIDFKNGNAGVGVLIADKDNYGKGYAKEALELIKNYASQVLSLRNIFCSIHADNERSIRLFENSGYEKVGVRKDWYVYNGELIDEILYQRCLKK